MTCKSVAPYHITIIKLRLKESFVQHKKSRQRREMSDLIEQDNILFKYTLFIYKMVNMTLKESCQ